MSEGAEEGWDPTRPAFGPRAAGGGASKGDGDPSEGTGGGAGGAGGGTPAGAESALLAPHMEGLAALAARTSDELEREASRYARWVVDTFRSGGKLLLCGNGGSAAIVEHVAAEYAVRFRRSRRPLPAVALTGSGPSVTAAGNDFGFEETFARQLRALARPGDLLVVHSTSGESENVVRAVRTATEMSLRSVGLLADGGGRVASLVSLALVVPTSETARAQEMHLALEHAVADRVDAAYAEEPE